MKVKVNIQRINGDYEWHDFDSPDDAFGFMDDEFARNEVDFLFAGSDSYYAYFNGVEVNE